MEAGCVRTLFSDTSPACRYCVSIKPLFTPRLAMRLQEDCGCGSCPAETACGARRCRRVPQPRSQENRRPARSAGRENCRRKRRSSSPSSCGIIAAVNRDWMSNGCRPSSGKKSGLSVAAFISASTIIFAYAIASRDAPCTCGEQRIEYASCSDRASDRSCRCPSAGADVRGAVAAVRSCCGRHGWLRHTRASGRTSLRSTSRSADVGDVRELFGVMRRQCKDRRGERRAVRQRQAFLVARRDRVELRLVSGSIRRGGCPTPDRSPGRTAPARA